MRSEARRAAADEPAAAIYELDDDLLLLAIDGEDGSLILRFNKNGHDPSMRRNQTERWNDYETHSLEGFDSTTHVILGYQLAAISEEVARITVTCPLHGKNHWSYELRTSKEGGVTPVNTEGPLDGMPPVFIRSLQPKREPDVGKGQGA